ncbi:MAG: hypothetical protein KA085_17205 [Phenylobacterium sp.]|uniref:hypothetical protein n=1 Tax=Phenylobacterium sp. TaxID=1871053 RepID=UPI001B5614BC|nr:hypothetical protein [Phenylobacterium sp.]MBP6546114.1 hypothetical protein [Phenylobacterium sp.]MBP7648616.1 hypothetical protein [Phenylobacterium sp.]MBP7817858.1 hypothetical protein [Phenylobacterium sp.]
MLVRVFATALLACTVLAGAPAFAGEFKSLSLAAFQEAAAKGRPIVLHVRTPDGALCKAQHAVLEKLMKEPAFSNHVVFEIDFASQPAAVAMTGAKLPATLIFNRGQTEMGRLTSVTEESAIRALLTK